MTNVDRAHFFSVNNSYLDNVRTFNYLGITLDSNMTLGSLFALVTRKVSMKLLPSGSEQNQVLRGVSIPIEYFVIGE